MFSTNTILNPNLPVPIYKDASVQGITAGLKQPQVDNEEKSITFYSNNQEKKNAILVEFQTVGGKFPVFSDHNSLGNMNIKSRTDEEI